MKNNNIQFDKQHIRELVIESVLESNISLLQEINDIFQIRLDYLKTSLKKDKVFVCDGLVEANFSLETIKFLKEQFKEKFSALNKEFNKKDYN